MKTKTKFSKLTAAQKRVAIAKDVLLQIKSRKISIRHNGYLEWKQHICIRTMCQTSLEKGHCTACAVGAAIASGIRKFNIIQTSEINAQPRKAFSIAKNWFSGKQIALIECAFEEALRQAIRINAANNSERPSRSEMERCEKFREKHGKQSAGKLVTAIFKNIIRNQGTFKP